MAEIPSGSNYTSGFDIERPKGRDCPPTYRMDLTEQVVSPEDYPNSEVMQSGGDRSGRGFPQGNPTLHAGGPWSLVCPCADRIGAGQTAKRSLLEFRKGSGAGRFVW